MPTIPAPSTSAFIVDPFDLARCAMLARPASWLSTTHPHAFHFDRAVDSYWEASADPLGIDDAAADGATSPATSPSSARASPGSRPRSNWRDRASTCACWRRAMSGWGASGRNGGFACIGSHKLSYGTMIRTYGLDGDAAASTPPCASRWTLVRDNLPPLRHRRLGPRRGRGDARPSAQPRGGTARASRPSSRRPSARRPNFSRRPI